MDENSDAAATGNWADFLLFFLAVAAVVFVFAAWTASIPINPGL